MSRVSRSSVSDLVMMVVAGAGIMTGLACGGSKDPVSPPALSGVVTDEDNAPIAAAQVFLLDTKLTVTTDAKGGFALSEQDLTEAGLALSSTADTQLALRVESPGFARAFRSLPLIPAREEIVRIHLPRAVPAQTITLPPLPQAAPGGLRSRPAEESVTVRQGELELEIPAGALVKADGTPVTGDVEVWMQPYDVNTLGDLRPGDLRSDAPQDQPRGLIPKALFNYTIKQNGELLHVAEGQQLSLSVGTSNAAAMLGTEHFFTIAEDSTTGLWHDEGPAIANDDGLWTVPVTHFSACCCFVPVRMVHFHGSVSNAKCELVKGIELQVAPTTTAITVTPNPMGAHGDVSTTVTTLTGAIESRTTDSHGEFHFSNMVADSGFGTVSITNDSARLPAGRPGERLLTGKLGNDSLHPLQSGQTYGAHFQYCLELESDCTPDSICCGGCCDDGTCRAKATSAEGEIPACDPAAQKMCPFDESMLEVH